MDHSKPSEILVHRDEKLLAAPEEQKPTLLDEFDEKEAKEKIEANALKYRRPPGETKLSLELNRSAPMDKENDQVHRDNRETSRRNQANVKTKIILKLFYNGKQVCQSGARPLTDEFFVPFGQIFPLRITQWPESLKVQIIEALAPLKTNVIAEVSLPIADATTSIDAAVLENVGFESDLRVKHDHTGIGSEIEFSFSAHLTGH